MSTDTREGRLERRIEKLFQTDAQFASAAPDRAVAAAADDPDKRLPEVMRIVFDGYADRPALGWRATELDTDADGRTVARLLPRFDTITYGELARRVRAAAAALQRNAIAPGDRVAILGFTSPDYVVVDAMLSQLGAISVPLQTSAPQAALQPIVAETEPVLIASSVDHVADAVELITAGPAPRRLIVFDYEPAVDAQREAYEAAVAALADVAVEVETLTDVLARGAELPAAVADGCDDDDGGGDGDGDGGDPIALLIYTSGSTGAPKGAIYPERKVAKSWRSQVNQRWDKTQGVLPAITLSFLPMSHVMGRSVLYGTLASGGTAYFASRADLSTFLDDLALVRPTQAMFVPRIWDMLHQEYLSRIERAGDETDDLVADLRRQLVGGRFVSAVTGSAPISPELKAWVEDFLDMHLVEGYGSTEAGAVFVDGRIQRPPVTDYKLVDVPELGYFASDVPNPRGELLVRSEQLFPGYYRRPDVTAEVFDADGFYRTGDIVVELGPDHLRYVDRRNNVLKLSQGEFVTVSKLEAAFGDSPLIRQIFVYGNSARPYLLAVVVPSDDAQRRFPGAELKPAIATSLKETARAAGLQSYEIPRDFLVETTPFTVENGLLTGIRKLAWPKLKARYGTDLERRYAELADDQEGELRELRRTGGQRPTLESVCRAAGALLSADAAEVTGDAQFTDLGGDSLSALTFSNLLRDVFDVEVPVGVIVSPAIDLAALAAYVDAERAGGAKRPTYAAVHGADAVEVRAADLTLDAFFDEATLTAAKTLPGPRAEIRTVLLTGATGFLGRYLALEWLRRTSAVGGKVIALVRARDDAAARARLDATFDSGDPALLGLYRNLAGEHLEVIAGDKGEANLGLDDDTWARLAATVDLIVDPAALVNHVLPYGQLFGPNVVGTAELLRVALTERIKPYVYVSTIAVVAGLDPARATEDADVRVVGATRPIDDSYANGYGNSKWAGEVLLRNAHDEFGLPASVFRCDMIMADTTYAGQLNVSDSITRMILSVVAAGVAPKSFYELTSEGDRQRAHYDGLPVEFIAEAISTLGVAGTDGFETFHVMNPHDDGVSEDTFVDWLIAAGYPIARVDDYGAWLDRFATTLRGLPDAQRQGSLLPLLHNYQKPNHPVNGALAPTTRFRTAVRAAGLGPESDIPHLRPEIIVKYATDLAALGLLAPVSRATTTTG